jgi:hypothetical protein
MEAVTPVGQFRCNNPHNMKVQQKKLRLETFKGVSMKEYT